MSQRHPWGPCGRLTHTFVKYTSSPTVSIVPLTLKALPKYLEVANNNKRAADSVAAFVKCYPARACVCGGRGANR